MVEVDCFPPGRVPHGWFLYSDGDVSGNADGGSVVAPKDVAAVPGDFLTTPRPYAGWRASLASIGSDWVSAECNWMAFFCARVAEASLAPRDPGGHWLCSLLCAFCALYDWCALCDRMACRAVVHAS